MEEQKIALKFIDSFEIHLNLTTAKSSQILNSELVTKVMESFNPLLAWLVTPADSPVRSSYESEVKTRF